MLRKKHWEKVYKNNNPNQVGWTQKIPQTSLDFIHALNLTKEAKIIDVGGGDGKLVDYLLNEGYKNITVLDISAKAIEKAKTRLGKNADKINWIVSDILEFKPQFLYDIWHDRASFHFLTSKKEIDQYIQIANIAVNKYMIIGTFSKNGPQKCSGLEVHQYSHKTLTEKFKKYFQKMKCVTEDHITPFNTKQNYIFCSFKKQT